jgi:hypothetical protein
MDYMLWFTIAVGGLLGTGACVYIWAVNHFRPDKPAPPARRPPAP